MDLPKSDLEFREQQNGYPTLRAYLDSNEETEAKALAAGGSDGPTGNEATALQNDGVTRADFPVGDALLSVLNQRGEVRIGGSIFKGDARQRVPGGSGGPGPAQPEGAHPRSSPAPT